MAARSKECVESGTDYGYEGQVVDDASTIENGVYRSESNGVVQGDWRAVRP